jgi:hypothetical protein
VGFDRFGNKITLPIDVLHFQLQHRGASFGIALEFTLAGFADFHSVVMLGPGLCWIGLHPVWLKALSKS